MDDFRILDLFVEMSVNFEKNQIQCTKTMGKSNSLSSCKVLDRLPYRNLMKNPSYYLPLLYEVL